MSNTPQGLAEVEWALTVVRAPTANSQFAEFRPPWAPSQVGESGAPFGYSKQEADRNSSAYAVPFAIARTKPV
jgi:hypothetical protein